MRRHITAAAGLMLLAGCGFFHKTVGLKSGTPEYQSPRTTSIYGSWVLGTPADSTAFAGASQVQLELQPGSFAITASYPSQAPLTLRGTAALADDGSLVLTPSSGTATGSRGALVMSAGQPLTLLASASGNTLVFSPPTGRALEPSSVWHKLEKAKQAGTVADTTTKKP